LTGHSGELERPHQWVVDADGGVCGGALAIGLMGATVLFGLCSFMALREFITLSPTKPGDHRTLFWFVAVVELSDVMQYVWSKTWEGFVGLGEAFGGPRPFGASGGARCAHGLRCAGFFHVPGFASVIDAGKPHGVADVLSCSCTFVPSLFLLF